MTCFLRELRKIIRSVVHHLPNFSLGFSQMKLIRKKSVATLSLLSIGYIVGAVGMTPAQAADLTLANFSSSCSNIRLVGSTLNAQCQTSTGKFINASFDLNPVVTNSDSQLKWQLNPSEDGNYTATTSNCSAVPVNGGSDKTHFTVLECDAFKLNGSVGHSHLLLDQYIENLDGHLVLRTDPNYPPCPLGNSVQSSKLL